MLTIVPHVADDGRVRTDSARKLRYVVGLLAAS
jgi:hypothetical protein